MFDAWAKKPKTEMNSDPNQSFQIWIDGVGGYLVCPSRQVWIGQAIPHSGIDIPLQGDLSRRHARIELREGSHVISPAAKMKIDGSETPMGFAALLDGQEIQFGESVRLKYKQPHPLSLTGRLDFASGNRTAPWSDAVLLAAQTIILGPNEKNHVFCPNWQQTLIVFKRDDQWLCRTDGKFEIDGKTVNGEGPIQLNSTISGEDFSMTLEPIDQSKR